LNQTASDIDVSVQRYTTFSQKKNSSNGHTHFYQTSISHFLIGLEIWRFDRTCIQYCWFQISNKIFTPKIDLRHFNITATIYIYISYCHIYQGSTLTLVRWSVSCPFCDRTSQSLTALVRLDKWLFHTAYL
jgi:hypothetical protein